MTTETLTPDAATGHTKLAAHTPRVREAVREYLDGQQDPPILDKANYARRWLFSRRHIDSLIAQGLPHLAIGTRRIRIVVAEADRWMIARYGTQRRGRAKAKQATPSAVPQEAA